MGALQEDLKTAKTEDSYNDVCLIGLDGSKTSASRFVLSMRSPVFHKMFFGNFKESKSSAVPLNFSSEIIQYIVNYCYSDDAGMKSIDDENWNEEEVRQMVRLIRASDFFELPKLGNAAGSLLLLLMMKKPAMTCAVVDELAAAGVTEGTFRDACLSFIGIKTEAALLPDDEASGRGILACSLDVIVTVLSDKVVPKQHHMLIIRSLQRWEQHMLSNNENPVSGEADKSQADEAKVHDDKQPTNPKSQTVQDDEATTDDDEEPTNPKSETVRSVGRIIASRVHLDLIAPSELVQLMTSTLFTKEQLYEALKEHALSAEVKGTIARPRVGESPQNGSVTSDGCCTVEGSGTPEAHGIYAKSPQLQDGVPKYVMNGRFMNVPVWFTLFQSDDATHGTKCWWLIATPEDGCEDIYHLYVAPIDEADAAKMPKHTWALHPHHPAHPTSRFGPVVLLPG